MASPHTGVRKPRKAAPGHVAASHARAAAQRTPRGVRAPTPADLGLVPAWALELGYTDVRRCGDAGVCGVRQMLFTAGVVVGITPLDYRGRYCFETVAAARAALAAWSGTGEPPGQWIKYKGVDGERLGPGCNPD
jgi:hypothetical protein